MLKTILFLLLMVIAYGFLKQLVIYLAPAIAMLAILVLASRF